MAGLILGSGINKSFSMQDKMNTNEHLDTRIMKPPPKVNEFRRIIRVMTNRWVVVIGLVIALAFIIVAIFAPLIAPYDPNKGILYEKLQQPSSAHLLGTDSVGRDTLSRVLYGTRVSLIIGVVSVTMAGIIGMSLGLIAGFSGGWLNMVIMRITDAWMSIPPLIFALVIATVLGPGLKNVIISLGIALVPGYCRMMCGEVLSLKENDYILAAYSVGSGRIRIMLRHILPNTFPVLLVLLTLNIGFMILAEAGLSFLGVGIRPPMAAWGAMVADGYKYLYTNPVLSFAPGISVMLLVLAFNLVGDGLRDALDPRL
jgi:peptide/nickel transport system permease protein